jgi:hypothetical protein
MSLKDTWTLAHTAQCKLHLAVNRPDRNWRFVVGHAVHLDSLMLRIVEMEEDIVQSEQSTDVKFKGAGNAQMCGGPPYQSSNTGRRRARSPPPPQRLDSSSEEEDEDVDGEDEDEGLGLTRFPSGSARSPQPPPLDPSDDSSSDEDEELLVTLPEPDPAVLKSITKEKGDEELASVYNSIKNCRCHKGHAPSINNIWELPQEGNSEKGNVRTAVVEIQV